MFGLLDRDVKYILEAIAKHTEIERVLIFGSRAMGNYKQGSDVDMAIIGLNVTSRTVCKLIDDLNEVYPLPYFFDIINYQEIINEKLKTHIDTEGREIYHSK